MELGGHGMRMFVSFSVYTTLSSPSSPLGLVLARLVGEGPITQVKWVDSIRFPILVQALEKAQSEIPHWNGN